MDDDVKDETNECDDLCYFEFLHAEAVKASRRICMRVQRGHTREEGEATTYKCGVY